MRLPPRFLPSLLLSTALLIVPASADDQFKPQEFALGNGMQVVVIPDHRAPVVTHMVWYKTGSADEPQNAGGIAHFFEHLMFRGTPKHPDGDFDALVSRNGGEHNANTSYDRTVYYQRVAKDRLDLVMGLEADRMQNLIIDDNTVPSERQVILEERNERTDNNPESLFYEQLFAALYLANPYQNPIIGWRSEIENLTTAEARDFYDKHYGPNNAILVVAGDVPVDEVRTLAEKNYGPVRARETVARVRPVEPPPIAARRVAMKDKRVAVPTFSRLYLVPSYKSAKGSDAYAIQVLSYILGGAGDSSRLGLALVKRDKICSSVSFFYDGDGIDDRYIGIYALAAAGEQLGEVEKAIDAEIQKFLTEGPTPEELARAKAVLVANATYARDSQEGQANYFGEGLTFGLTLADLEAWPDRIDAVTLDQVKAVAATYLKPERSVTGTLEPDGAPGDAPPQGAPTGVAP
ncbi:MAG: insulinase family protein [Alphaproteobacteria bacterium]|nr:insulinase family protein [Alphaproteobacteria bacterium]